MIPSRWMLPAAIAFVSLGVVGKGQDVVSGPDVGAKIPALKVFDATGPHQGKDVDYTAERGTKATVFVFIQADKWDRPMARFLRDLDKEAGKENAFVVAVWLTADADKTKNYLPLAQQSIRFEHTALTCFPGERAGPEGWGINADAHLTAVVANGAKVAMRFGYQSLNETNVPDVVSALRKARQER